MLDGKIGEIYDGCTMEDEPVRVDARRTSRSINLLTPRKSLVNMISTEESSGLPVSNSHTSSLDQWLPTDVYSGRFLNFEDKIRQPTFAPRAAWDSWCSTNSKRHGTRVLELLRVLLSWQNKILPMTPTTVQFVCTKFPLHRCISYCSVHWASLSYCLFLAK